MKILIIGSGGREHALAWKVAQNKEISRVYVAPGNAGTATNPDMVNVPITKVDDLVKFAKDEQIGLTIVGPEAPLSQGVVDAQTIYAFLVQPKLPLSWKAPKILPKRLCSATVFPPPNIKLLPMPNWRTIM
jgi:Phosphoribosylglycinamide synthetase, N domain